MIGTVNAKHVIAEQIDNSISSTTQPALAAQPASAGAGNSNPSIKSPTSESTLANPFTTENNRDNLPTTAPNTNASQPKKKER